MQLDIRQCLNPDLEESRKHDASLLPYARTMVHILTEFGNKQATRISKEVYGRLANGLTHPQCVTPVHDVTDCQLKIVTVTG